MSGKLPLAGGFAEKVEPWKKKCKRLGRTCHNLIHKSTSCWAGTIGQHASDRRKDRVWRWGGVQQDTSWSRGQVIVQKYFHKGIGMKLSVGGVLGPIIHRAPSCQPAGPGAKPLSFYSVLPVCTYTSPLSTPQPQSASLPPGPAAPPKPVQPVSNYCFC